MAGDHNTVLMEDTSFVRAFDPGELRPIDNNQEQGDTDES